MASKWSRARIGDLCDITRGGSPRPIHDYLQDVGVPWVKIADATASSSRFIKNTSQYIKPEGLNKTREVFPGDLIVSNSATPGIPRFMKIYAAIHDGWLLLRNFKGLDKDFCFYLIEQERPKLLLQGNGSVFTNLKTDILKNHIVNLPPEDEQRAIANILKSIDDKIELNRQMSETLEAIAQALFKSWFVDFDPVIDNALAAGNEIPEPLQARASARKALGDQRKPLPSEIQAQFPSRFVLTDEMGWIPEGWSVTAFETICGVRKGLSYKGKCLSDNESATPMMNLGNFGGGGKFRTEKIKYYEGEYKERHLVRAGQLMIANTDMTQDRVILGSPIIVPEFDSEEIIFTHHTFAVDFNVAHPESLWKRYLYFVSLGPEFRKRAEGFSTGTTVLAMPKDALLNCPLMLPNEELVKHFNEFVKPLFDKRSSATQQIRELSITRGTLLPKLLSGELRVTDAQQQVAEAL